MTARTTVHHLEVATVLHTFIESKVLPGIGISSSNFWKDFDRIVTNMAPKNQALLDERDRLQTALDQWHEANPGPISKDSKSPRSMGRYRKFLTQIGYLVKPPSNVQISTINVDTELALQAGPQLVVPVLNARYALNAANARWGSLYDALYGTDAISEANGCGKLNAYNPKRGAKVIEYARHVLDRTIPLQKGSHIHSVGYSIKNRSVIVKVADGTTTTLANQSQCIGFQGDPNTPHSVLFINNGLHLDLRIDRNTAIGKADPAGVSDLVIESALSTILDLEDSVAVVDADDKVLAYSNWLGILQGTLTDSFNKGGKIITRGLNPDRTYTPISGKGKRVKLHGRSLMFLRNVGHLMSNPAILYKDKKGIKHEIPEGILDAVVTTAIAMHDLKRTAQDEIRNSRKGSVYIVKPKMHGPAEVAFADELFERVEKMLGLPKSTVKLGIMDEERRTSVNLKACIAAAKSRVAFINTGFLDRTGDEMHTAMHAGPMIRKNEMKASSWISAYERNNVSVGLACGLRGKAQIGKGMWAMPDLMKDMLTQKIVHPLAGANTAWVPSPTAATLHALHYHQVKVSTIQKKMEKNKIANNYKELLNGLLRFPVSENTDWSQDEKQQELDNNVQGILGYVVRWIDQGVGCSKVPDIHNIGLMEDRATLRISSQHIANWLLHGIVEKTDVTKTFERMASVVDQQNKGDPLYKPMTGNFKTSKAFKAATDLVFKGLSQPSGYTEPLLHAWRLKVKAVSGK